MDLAKDWYLTIAALAVAGVASYAITPLSARLARRFGILDHPAAKGSAAYKVHGSSIPYLGGVAIFCGLLAGSPFILVSLGAEAVQIVKGFPLAILVALFIGLIGLADDVRPLPRTFRLGVQVAASAAAWLNGFQVSITPWEPVNLLLTALWIVGITNAFNLLDNMDGLTAGIAGIAALSFAAMGAAGGMPALAIVAASLAGASFGFLAHNKHPAKIFMGDAGSLFLGLLLALIAMRLRFDNLVEVTFLVPVVVLGIPIFDTTLVVLSRWRHGRPIFLGGRDHASHRLVRVGLPIWAAVGLLYFAGLCLGWLGLVISRSTPEIGWMLLGFVGAVGIFLGALLWRVPVYDEEPEAIERDQDAIEREGIAYLAAVDNASEQLPTQKAQDEGEVLPRQ